MTGSASASIPSLPRVLGRWSLTALVINSIIGSSVFGLPGTIAGLLGTASPWAYIIAGAGMAVIVACFAEVSSYFSGAGGQYLYAREAYGRFAGIWMAWLFVLVRVTAAGSNADLFARYLSLYLPGANGGVLRIAVITVLIGGLAAVNVRGVSAGANLSNVFAVSKLLPLLIFVVAGVIAIVASGNYVPEVPKAPATKEWFDALLLLVFAYGGFEAALVPMAEAKEPRKDAPFALLVALATCIAIYTLVQYVVIAALGAASAGHKTPLAAAAEAVIGPAGALLMTVGALLSMYGYMSANILNAPRMLYALGAERDLPTWLATVHSRYATPYVAIVGFALLVWGFAVPGNFEWNAMLSAITRLLVFAAVCGAVMVLRRRRPGEAAVPIPGAPVFALLGIAFSAVLATRMRTLELAMMAGTAALALATYVWSRRRVPA